MRWFMTYTPANPNASAPQEKIFCDLLRDRARATHASALAFLERFVNRLEIEAVMIGKRLILRGDHGDFHRRGDLLPINPRMAHFV